MVRAEPASWDFASAWPRGLELAPHQPMGTECEGPTLRDHLGLAHPDDVRGERVAS